MASIEHDIPLADDTGHSFHHGFEPADTRGYCAVYISGLSFTDDITDQIANQAKPAKPLPRPQSESFEDQEEKARLISQVLELQNTLDDLSQRVDSVKEESLKLRSENQVLGQYIENLMAASSVFQSTNPKSKTK